MRYCTYIWLTVMVPGTEGPTAGVPGWLDVVVTPLMKKLPSSASSSGPPSDAAMAVPPVASSAAAAAMAAQKFHFLRIMATSPFAGDGRRAHPRAALPRRSAEHMAQARTGKRTAARTIAGHCPPAAATLPLNQQGGTGLPDRGGTYYSPLRGPSDRVGGMRPAGAGDDRGHNGGGPTRIAGQRHRPGDGRRHHARRLCADPVARRAPRLGDLSAARAARGLASRPHPGAGRGSGRRAVVRIFLLLALLQ